MDITIIRSKRKTISIQITPDLSVVVRAPYRCPKREIDRVLEEKKDWIEKHIKRMQEQAQNAEPVERFTKEEIDELARQALEYIPGRVRYYADVIGVDYAKITIRNQKTRWGSCSGKGGLNFNCLLMKTPPEVIDYVVVHELCHRKEMNHSKQFWNEVERILPDYKMSVKWLKEHGSDLMRRMHG